VIFQRPDESDDYRLVKDENESENVIELRSKEISSSIENATISTSERVLKVLIEVVCGFERFDSQSIREESAKRQNELESIRRVENFRSLCQTKPERLILNINCLAIFALSIGLFVFFSVPPEHHIFKHLVELNISNLNNQSLSILNENKWEPANI
jgi:hypothetical protein